MSFSRCVRRFFRKRTTLTLPNILPGNTGNHFEFYVFTLVLRGVRKHFDLVPSNQNGVITTGVYDFNCGPSQYNNNDRFTITKINNPAIQYEVVSGVQFVGNQMMHEVDIAVIDPNPTLVNSTNLAHVNATYPTKKCLCLFIECKNYDQGKLSSLKSEIRQSLGAVTDLADIISIQGQSRLVYQCAKRTFNSIFATNLHFQHRNDFRNYLTNYYIAPFDQLDPRNPAIVASFTQNIENMSAQW